MEFSIKLHGWSIVYIEGSQIIIFKKYCISFFEDQFVLANSAAPDEMLYHAVFNIGLYCLPMYQFRGFWSPKGYSHVVAF